MWKTFEYSGRQRVAYIPPTGPAYQVLDAGKPVNGFRAFIEDRMENVASADNLFRLIPSDVVTDYPELEKAQ